MTFFLGFNVFLVFLCGCGPGFDGVPVTGTVTFQQKGVEGATVTFIFDDGEGLDATAITDASGNFQMTTADVGKVFNGVLPGKYRVTVRKYEAAPSSSSNGTASGLPDGISPPGQKHPASKQLLPVLYGSATKTPLDAVVEKGKKNHFEFHLTE